MKRIVVLLLSLVSYLSSVEAYSSTSQTCQKQSCVAVVDAGSTGTRVHIYAFDRNQDKKAVNIKEIWYKKINPGFASIDPSPEAINNYLNILFSQTPETNIPVFFYATAGMRLLPEPKQGLFYNGLKQWFANHNEWQLQEARTITGKEEGVLAWLSVNHQLKQSKGESSSNVGVMDMGGASVQIVFPVQDDDFINPDDITTVELNGQQVKLFVHSFLGLGQTVFAYQFLDVKSCYPNQYKLPSGLIGEGDAETCQSDVTKLINVIHEVNNVTQPALAQNSPEQWFVLGGISYLVNDKPFHFKSTQFTSQDLFEQGNIEVCSKSWNDLLTENQGHADIHNYCLFPSYYYALLVNGYGINPEQPINLLPSKNSSDWTLGVVLHLN